MNPNDHIRPTGYSRLRLSKSSPRRVKMDICWELLEERNNDSLWLASIMLQKWRPLRGWSFEESGESEAWSLLIRGDGPEKRSRSGLLQSDAPL